MDNAATTIYRPNLHVVPRTQPISQWRAVGRVAWALVRAVGFVLLVIGLAGLGPATIGVALFRGVAWTGGWRPVDGTGALANVALPGLLGLVGTLGYLLTATLLGVVTL